MPGSLPDLLGGAMAFFFYFAAGLVELRTSLAIQLFNTMLDLVRGMLGFVLYLAARFTRLLIGTLLIGGCATRQKECG